MVTVGLVIQEQDIEGHSFSVEFETNVNKLSDKNFKEEILESIDGLKNWVESNGEKYRDIAIKKENN